MSEREPDARAAAMRGYLVEGVRLIFIALLATGGFLLGGTSPPRARAAPWPSSSSARRSAS